MVKHKLQIASKSNRKIPSQFPQLFIFIFITGKSRVRNIMWYTEVVNYKYNGHDNTNDFFEKHLSLMRLGESEACHTETIRTVFTTLQMVTFMMIIITIASMTMSIHCVVNITFVMDDGSTLQDIPS